jgi:hypothetical protein
MTHQIKLTYINIADEKLPIKALTILEGVGSNPKYANPPTPLSEIRQLVLTFEESLSLSTLDKRENPNREKLCKQIKLKLHELAAHVISKAENDLNALLGTGFDITMPKRRFTPGGLTMKYGKSSGQMISTMRGIRRARAYWHQYTTLPVTEESVWTEVVSKSFKHTYTGLQRGTEYAFRAKILTKEGKEVLSDMVVRIVL